MLVVSGRALAFGIAPSVLVDVAEHHGGWPTDKTIAHEALTNVAALLVSTALFDAYTMLVKN